MKRFISIRWPKFFGIGCLVFLCAIFSAQVSAQYNSPPADCPPMLDKPCNTPQTTNKNQAWPPGAKVTVNIDPSFSSATANGIKQAFQNWQSGGVSNGNGSGVTFTFTSNQNPPSMTPPPGTYNAQVWNQNSPRNSGLGGDNAVTPNPNASYIISQEIWINTQTTDACAASQTAAHEIGHGFGLGECPNCSDNTSVMNAGTNGYNSLTGTYGPTTCDNTAVKTVAQYPESKVESSGGGGGRGGNIQAVDYYECTTYYWVLYYSWDDGQSWYQVDSWEAGCW